MTARLTVHALVVLKMRYGINLETLVEAEERVLIGIEGYSNSELDKHRIDYSIEERIVSITPFRLLDDYQRKLLGGIYARIFEHDRTTERYKKRLLAIMRKVYGHEISNILKGNSIHHPEFRKIKITEEAYKKANKIAKRVVEVSNLPNEVYLYCTGDKAHRGVKITDVIIPPQFVSPVQCRVDPAKSTRVHLDLDKQGKQLVGWAHSHGNMNVFFSPTDDQNLQHVPDSHGKKIEIELTSFAPGKTEKFEVFVAPCLVFNAKDSYPSMKIVSEYTGFRDYNSKIVINENPELEIVDKEQDTSIDMSIIDKQILERVIPTGGFKKEFTSRMCRIKKDYNPNRTAKMNIPNLPKPKNTTYEDKTFNDLYKHIDSLYEELKKLQRKQEEELEAIYPKNFFEKILLSLYKK